MSYMTIEISEHEYHQLREITAKLYNGSGGADCPSTVTKALRLLDKLKDVQAESKRLSDVIVRAYNCL